MIAWFRQSGPVSRPWQHDQLQRRLSVREKRCFVPYRWVAIAVVSFGVDETVQITKR